MRILVTGASGKLGGYLARAGREAGLALTLWSRSQPASSWGHPLVCFDLLDFQRVEAELERSRPDVILHTAALSAVADCYRDPELAERVNHHVVELLAGWCHRRGSRLLFVSTDMVFDGEEAPYHEDSVARPLSCYGASKLRGEQAALGCDNSLVARVALMVGPALGQARSYYDQIVDDFRAGKVVSLFADEWRSMLSYPRAAQALLQLAAGEQRGLLHVGGERRSRLELGFLVAGVLGRPELVLAGQRADHPAPEPRARDLSLDTQRLRAWLPNWSAGHLPDEILSWLT